MPENTNTTLTRVPGLKVGHWTAPEGTTGVTAVLFPAGARCGVHLVGSAAGTRQMGVFDPSHVSNIVHGLCLSGGSAFGLAAADGVVAYLEAQGIGFDTGQGMVPIVPAAIIFDLAVSEVRPGPDGGRQAAECASHDLVAQGRVGAGAGGTVAKWSGERLPGGVGSAASTLDGYEIGAIAVVNALGSIYDPVTNTWVAGPPEAQVSDAELQGDWAKSNTTLVAVATNAPLDGPLLTVLARMAAAGMARTIYPAFTPFDGDVVFTFSTGVGESLDRIQLARLGHEAARLVAEAIVNAVR